MSELDDFLADTLARQVAAEEAIHNGDPTPRMEMWSTRDPVTLFGAWGPCNSGWEEVSRTFRWVASRFSDGTAYSFDLVAAGVSGDLAYTVGYERSAAAVDGGPVAPAVLALGALSLFGLVAVLTLARADNWSEAKEALTVLLPVAMAILGAAVGYFFGRTTS